MTATIQIGNSDDKLTQKNWAAFMSEVQGLLEYGWLNDKCRVHFFGHSSPVADSAMAHGRELLRKLNSSSAL